MTLTKHKMIAEIACRTQLRNRDVQQMVETLLTLWEEHLLEGGRIELENVFVLEIVTIDRGSRSGTLHLGSNARPAPRLIRRLILRASKHWKSRLNDAEMR